MKPATNRFVGSFVTDERRRDLLEFTVVQDGDPVDYIVIASA